LCDLQGAGLRASFGRALGYFVIGIGIILFQMGCTHFPSDKKDLNQALLLDQELLSKESPRKSEYQFLTKEEDGLIAPGDLIALTYSADPKLNGRFRFQFDGTVQLPYNFKIKGAGLKLSELSKLIHTKYGEIYKNSQEIQVSLIERKRWIQITGDISVTGLRLVEPGTDLTEILSLKSSAGLTANSTEERKKLKFLKIKWNNSTSIIDLKKYFRNEISWEDRKWRGGEILSFQSNLTSDEDEWPMIRVLGEVSEPGSYQFTEKSDYFSYILKAGGLTSSADIDRIYIVRGPPFQREAVQVSLEDLSKYGRPNPNDTLLLMRDRTSLTERRFSMAASFASILSTLLLFKVLF